jgi:hypothetical protein
MKQKITFLTKAAALLLVMLFSLNGARAQQALPYSYGFEDNDLTADGWVLQGATSSSTGISDYAAQNGSYGFRFQYSEQSAYLISPVLTGSEVGISLSFWYKEYSNTYGDEQFQVGYTTDESVTDAEAFTYGNVVTASTDWQEYTQSFPEGTTRIAIKYIYNDAFYLYLDDFSFTAFPNPKNLTVSPAATQATVTWNGTADSYNVRYRTTEKTETFFLEDFENGLPDTWTIIDNDGDGNNWYSLNTSAEYCHSGTGLVTSASYSGNALTPDNWLITPQLDLQGTLSVWLRGQDPSWAEEHFAIYVSTTGNNVADFTTELVGETVATGDYLEYTADLGAYAGQTGYIAIRHFNITDMFRLNVDDFGLFGATIPASAWVNINNATSPCTIDGLAADTEYEVEVQAVYAASVSEWIATTFTTAAVTDAPVDLAATDVKATTATLNWTGYQDNYTLQYREALPVDPSEPATIILTAGDVWGDGSGYQMLIDADATAYETAYNSSDGWTISDYSDFEYIIPADAEFDSNTSAFVINNSVTIQIPAGTYDWYITNPTPDDRVYIAGGNGNVGGRYDDFVFEPGVTYEFTMQLAGSGDGVFLTINRPMSDWTVVENVTAPYDLTDLTPNTYYEWQVQGNLTEETTEWSEMSSFTTLDAVSLTVGSTLYTTFVAPSDVSFPSNLTAFKVVDKTETAVIMEAVEAIPAGAAVVVKAEAAGTYYLEAATTTDDMTGNLLQASDGTVQGGSSIYALANKDQGIGFYPVASTVTIPAGKAYLVIETKAKAFYGLFEDDATVIDNLNVDANLNETIYNVAGQRINKAQKGVNIINGKKILK